MKCEAISFQIIAENALVDLDDTTLVPKAFIGFISKNGSDVKANICIDDLTRHKSVASTDNGTKKTIISEDKSILAYEGNTKKVEGYISSVSAGEMSFTFNTYTTGYCICGLVIGE